MSEAPSAVMAEEAIGVLIEHAEAAVAVLVADPHARMVARLRAGRPEIALLILRDTPTRPGVPASDPGPSEVAVPVEKVPATLSTAVQIPMSWAPLSVVFQSPITTRHRHPSGLLWALHVVLWATCEHYGLWMPRPVRDAPTQRLGAVLNVDH